MFSINKKISIYLSYIIKKFIYKDRKIFKQSNTINELSI